MKALSHHARQGHLLRLINRRQGPGLLLDETPGRNEDRAIVDQSRLLELLFFLRNDPDADLTLLVDLTAIDHADAQGNCADPRGRFEVLYHLRSPRIHYRMLLSTFLPAADPTVPSVTSLFPAGDWFERELWDVFGIYADGHPYLRHLLLFAGFSGHPMRNDYPAEKTQPLVALRSRGKQPTIIQTMTRAQTDDESTPSNQQSTEPERAVAGRAAAERVAEGGDAP